MAKRLDLVYGVTQSGKTSWWERVGRYIFERTGKRTRWYLGDGGGETLRVTGSLVRDGGFIELVRYPLWDHPFETSIAACEGGWPVDPDDPKSPWLPPQGDLADVYGLLVYEGLNSMCDYLMGDREGGFAHMAAHKKNLNNEPAPQWQDGKLSVGGNSRGHYGFTQRRLKMLVERTERFPGWVGWTAHERRETDEDNRETIIGPATAGGAITTSIGASFGNVIHLDMAAKREKTKDPHSGASVEHVSLERRAYTQTHLDPDGQHFVRYLAGARIPATCKNFPDYFSPPDPLAFYAQLDAAERAHGALEQEAFEKIMVAI